MISGGVRGTLNVANARRRVRSAAQRGLGQAAEHVLGVSQGIVPIEEGTLSRSGTTSVDGLKASVSYDTPYAARQHEEMGWQHDAGRSAKYLEKPLNAERGTAAKIVADTIRGEVGR